MALIKAKQIEAIEFEKTFKKLVWNSNYISNIIYDEPDYTLPYSNYPFSYQDYLDGKVDIDYACPIYNVTLQDNLKIQDKISGLFYTVYVKYEHDDVNNTILPKLYSTSSYSDTLLPLENHGSNRFDLYEFYRLTLNRHFFRLSYVFNEADINTETEFNKEFLDIQDKSEKILNNKFGNLDTINLDLECTSSTAITVNNLDCNLVTVDNIMYENTTGFKVNPYSPISIKEFSLSISTRVRNDIELVNDYKNSGIFQKLINFTFTTNNTTTITTNIPYIDRLKYFIPNDIITLFDTSNVENSRKIISFVDNGGNLNIIVDTAISVPSISKVYNGGRYANTMYYLWIIRNRSFQKMFLILTQRAFYDIEINTTKETPGICYNDFIDSDNYDLRYLGMIKTDSSENIIPFRMEMNGTHQKMIHFGNRSGNALYAVTYNLSLTTGTYHLDNSLLIPPKAHTVCYSVVNRKPETMSSSSVTYTEHDRLVGWHSRFGQLLNDSVYQNDTLTFELHNVYRKIRFFCNNTGQLLSIFPIYYIENLGLDSRENIGVAFNYFSDSL